MKSALICLLLATGLAGCGGGEPGLDAPVALARATPSALANTGPSAAAASTLDLNLLLNWAESSYPQFFPGRKTTLSSAPYEYRYYAETGNYVGVAGDDVYILGPVSNQLLQRVGNREDFRCQVLPASCLPTLYARAGWSARLSSLQHGVSGTVTIVDARTLRLSGFNYDGGGPRVYAYLGTGNNNAAFSAGPPIGALLQRRPYVNETLDLQLPEGQSLDNYSAISIWCVEFRVNFGSGLFVAPGQ